MIGNIIDGPTSLTHRITGALNVGADHETLHEILVVEEKVCTEEEFFLAYHAAEKRLKYLEETSPSTGR